MALGKLFGSAESAPPKHVEIGTGLLIDGKPVPSGVRVRVPADMADYLIAQRWAREVDRGHRTPRGVLKWHPVRAMPGVGVGLEEWPSHMRPAWMRTDSRVRLAEGLPHLIPTYCTACERVNYGRQREGAERTSRGVQQIVCKDCIQPTHVSRQE